MAGWEGDADCVEGWEEEEVVGRDWDWEELLRLCLGLVGVVAVTVMGDVAPESRGSSGETRAMEETEGRMEVYRFVSTAPSSPTMSCGREWETQTHRPSTVQQPHREIPHEQPPILPDASESVTPPVAPPCVERHRRDPGSVAAASCDELALLEGPDRYQVILSAGEDVFAVRGPREAGQAAVVGGV